MSLIPSIARQKVILRMAQLMATRGSSRALGTTALRAGVIDSKQSEVAECYKRIPPLQKKFQMDNGLPVHLKGGPFDYILYYVTIALTVAGVAMTLEFFYRASFPKREK